MEREPPYIPGGFILVDNIFEYYKEYAETGEKLGFFIDRVGIDKFKKEVIKDIVEDF